METRTPSVNLLKTKGNNFLDKFISWALTIGRMVIILTETIALVAFLYRFVLDRQLIDQKDRITQKAAQIKYLESSEKTYRNLQSRLQLISQVQKQASLQVASISDIVNIAPRGVTFNSLSISPQSIHVEANAQSVAALSAFVNKLRQNPDIESVSIDKIENKTVDGAIIVGISTKLRQKPETAIPK